jgi:cytochrome c5
MNHSNRIGPFKLRRGAALAVAAVSAFLVPLALLAAAEGKDEKAAKNDKPPGRSSAADAAKPKPKAPPKKLTGAELYSMHCNRCHAERYPTERTAAQWKTILLHMRVRANLPAEQARTILKYLQDNSGR